MLQTIMFLNNKKDALKFTLQYITLHNIILYYLARIALDQTIHDNTLQNITFICTQVLQLVQKHCTDIQPQAPPTTSFHDIDDTNMKLQDMKEKTKMNSMKLMRPLKTVIIPTITAHSIQVQAKLLYLRDQNPLAVVYLGLS